MASHHHATELANRLNGLPREHQIWLHLDSASSLDKYPAKQHAHRVSQRLNVENGLVYLPGSPAQSNEDSDMPAPFRQRRYFYYLSGCNEPSCHMTYDIRRDVLTLFIPRVNPDRVFWNGRGSTPAEALNKYDVDEVFYVDQLNSWIQDWFLHYRSNDRLYVLRDDQIPDSRFPWPVDAKSLKPAMDLCRMIKDDHEIKLIRKANDISSEAHRRVFANITKFDNEAQVEGLFVDVCISKQAKQQAYDPIAASGPNAGTLHYDANNEDFGDRQLMCLDAGCEFDLYASDITRTFPLSGSWPSKEARNIYKLVERMQESCIRKLAAGVRYLDLHILAHHIAIDGLLRLGIFHNGTREEIYKAGTSKAFFPHGLGHHVGLEVHDVGQRELMSLGKVSEQEKVPSLYPQDYHMPVYDNELCMAPAHPLSPHLEEGNVVTVEPGIYFSKYALNHFYLPSPIHSRYINKEVLARYMPVGGVRIEDDLLITSNGYENLTTAPKGDAMLEIIRTGCEQPASSSSVPKAAEKSNQTELPLRRAPGIAKRVSDPIIRSLSRAATEPLQGSKALDSTERKSPEHSNRISVSMNPVAAAPIGVKEQGQEKRMPTKSNNSQLSLCGNRNEDFEHLAMTWQDAPTQSQSFSSYQHKIPKPKCQQCIVLFETVFRLRETLNRSTRTSANSEPSPAMVPHIQPPSANKKPEIQQAKLSNSRSREDEEQRRARKLQEGSNHPPPPGVMRKSSHKHARVVSPSEEKKLAVAETTCAKPERWSVACDQRPTNLQSWIPNWPSMQMHPCDRANAPQHAKQVDLTQCHPLQFSSPDAKFHSRPSQVAPPSIARTTYPPKPEHRPQPAASRDVTATHIAPLKSDLTSRPSLQSIRPAASCAVRLQNLRPVPARLAAEPSRDSQVHNYTGHPMPEYYKDLNHRRSIAGGLGAVHTVPSASKLHTSNEPMFDPENPAAINVPRTNYLA